MATSSGRCAGNGGELGEPLVETFARDQLHAEEMPPLVSPDLVNRHDVGMVELRDRLGLVLKAHKLGFRGENARLDHLERDRPVERDLVGFEDDAHSTSAQLAPDLVAVAPRARAGRPAKTRPTPSMHQHPSHRRMLRSTRNSNRPGCSVAPR